MQHDGACPQCQLAAIPPAFAVLMRAIDTRDRFTGEHNRRVTALCLQIADVLDLGDFEQHTLRLEVSLHDIGKVGIPDRLLPKRGPLSAAERRHFQTHAELGARMIEEVFPELTPAVLHHHGFWNGRGYPHGLAGDALPLHARIMAVADSYDAMTSDRVYRKGMPGSDAKAIMVLDEGNQSDQALVAVLLQVC